MSFDVRSITSALIEALARETAQAAGAETTPISLTFDVVGEGEAAAISAHVVRTTKTLVFCEGEARDAGGRRLIAATAVHKIVR